jgi:hypothetical protein
MDAVTPPVRTLLPKDAWTGLGGFLTGVGAGGGAFGDVLALELALGVGDRPLMVVPLVGLPPLALLVLLLADFAELLSSPPPRSASQTISATTRTTTATTATSVRCVLSDHQEACCCMSTPSTSPWAHWCAPSLLSGPPAPAATVSFHTKPTKSSELGIRYEGAGS